MLLNFGEGNKGKMKCSFCGKTQEQVRKLVAGPGVYICDECVKLCDEIVEEEVNDTEPAVFLFESPEHQYPRRTDLSVKTHNEPSFPSCSSILFYM